MAEGYKNIPMAFKDINFRLENLTWSQSAGGMYYAKYDTGISGTMVSVSCLTWGNLSTTTIIFPYLETSTNRLCFASSRNDYIDSSYAVRIVYIPS